MSGNMYVLARNVLERVIPKVCAKHPSGRERELLGYIKETLSTEQVSVYLDPFNSNERQVFLSVEPNIHVIVRMVYAGKKWHVAPPKSLEAPENTIWRKSSSKKTS